jgi:hypothetical protein
VARLLKVVKAVKAMDNGDGTAMQQAPWNILISMDFGKLQE